MKGFQLDVNGDVSMTNGKIDMIDGHDLLCQTVRTILGTNQGEWWFNQNEGIVFDNILRKNPIMI